MLTASFYFICETALLQRLSADDKRIAEENILRLKMALSYETQNLASKAADWSNWDDLYQYIENKNTAFIETNLVPQAFTDLEVNLMVFTNASSSIVFGKAYYLDNMTEMSIDQTSLKSIIVKASTLNDESETIQGFITYNESTLLVVARPILKSSYEGPSRGALIFGILFDESEIAKLSNVVGLRIECYSANDINMAPDFLIPNSTIAMKNSTFHTLVTDTEISGYMPIQDINAKILALVGTVDSRQSYAETKTEILILSIMTITMGLVFLTVFYFSLDKFVLSRLSNLNRSVARISENGYLTERTQTRGNDEVSDLSKRINDMLDQISESQAKLSDYALTLEKKIDVKKRELEEANERLIKSQRLAAIGELAGMVAHDLRNPLTGIKNAAYLLKKKQGDQLGDNGKETLVMMDKAIDHASKIIADLLDYSRELHLDYEECSPKSLVSYSLLSLEIPNEIKVIEAVENSPEIWVDVNKMQRVFTNLIKNAIDAMPKGGSIEISSKHDEKALEFSIADTGIGMNDSVVQRIFTPLFTTKAQGMGFGLSICKRIVEAHNGKIEVESILNKGTKFTIALPLKPEAKKPT